MKHRIIILSVLALGLIGLLCWLLPRREVADGSNGKVLSAAPTGATEKSSILKRAIPSAAVTTNLVRQSTEAESIVNRSYDEWRAPIGFFGLVVDENTNRIAGADVHFIWTDLSTTGTSERNATSDLEGGFRLQNVTGKTLTVQVSKAGYYAYKNYPVGFFYAGENENFVSDINAPVVFKLRKKGKGEPLTVFERDFLIAKNGEPVRVDLTIGNRANTGDGNLVVECWTNDQGKKPGEKYDWRCRISVPGGGLLMSTNQFDFEAPADGYLPSDEINMPAALESARLALGWAASYTLASA